MRRVNAGGPRPRARRRRGRPKTERPRPPPPGGAPQGGAPGEPAAIAPASPAVRRLAREIGVEITDVQGTGPAGRISQDDVKEHARRILSSVGAAGATPA